MYRKTIKEHGLLLSLLLHWALYYFALHNNAADNGFDGRLNYSIQWGSLPLLGICVALMFYHFMDDCNVRYLPACIFSMSLRLVVIIFKPWGLDSSSTIMIVCGISLLFYFPAEYLYLRGKRRKLYL